ncbi:hypothetical protein [Aestuariicoccus sp. MJ-SS9]|uniref:cupin domain-containing protein n=1 Tax=Aestuariicoccus sp. MJ-SS9 TaxID=3079855 RepID=UPI002908906F|nr:hypothetical protein [Aestuariicoccus sp. MJ-SS9]MDU8913862.1 hypothetical protein [Aestuariicoccus sp. MJ-SS9]
MTPQAFDRICKKEGYGAPKQVRFEALARSAPHVHDQVSFVYFLEGEFILNPADGAPRYLAGKTCFMEKNIEHAEEAGKDGAVTLVTRKWQFGKCFQDPAVRPVPRQHPL